MRIGFRLLTEGDLPLLFEWLQREHIRRWWDKHDTYEKVAEHYLPAIRGDDPTDLYVIELDGEATGFIETYLVSDYPEYEAMVATGEGVAGVDLFVADESRTGRGLGSRILAEFVSDVVFAAPATTACIAGPEANNLASIRAFEKAGFTAVRTFRVRQDDDRVHVLLRRDRRRETQNTSADVLARAVAGARFLKKRKEPHDRTKEPRRRRCRPTAVRPDGDRTRDERAHRFEVDGPGLGGLRRPRKRTRIHRGQR
jgi:aminoglycoside 6'-N-acetyltransferase